MSKNILDLKKHNTRNTRSLLLAFLSFLLPVFSLANYNAENPIVADDGVIFISEGAVIVSEGAIIYEKSEERSSENGKGIVSEGEIFISPETVFYSADALENIKITKVEAEVKKENPPKLRLAENRAGKKISEAKKELSQKKTLAEYKKSPSENTFFSNNIKEQIVCAQNQTQPSSKNVILFSQETDKCFLVLKNKRIFKKNSFVTSNYFFGKYSIRPPTWS